MKNLIIIGLLAFVFATPLGARAQTTTPVTNEQLLEIIQSLMQQVLSLMEQLKKIEATQTASSQTLAAPVLGAVQAITAPTLSATLGTPYCKKPEGQAPIGVDKTQWIKDNQHVELPIVVSGDNWNYGTVTIKPSNRPAYSESFGKTPTKKVNIPSAEDSSNRSFDVTISLDSQNYSFADTVIPDTCQ